VVYLLLSYVWTHFLVEDPVLPSPEHDSYAGTVTFNRLAYYAAGSGEEEGMAGGEDRVDQREEKTELKCGVPPCQEHHRIPQDRSPPPARGHQYPQHQALEHTTGTTTHTFSDPSLQLEYDTGLHTHLQAHHETHPSQETQETQEHRGGFDVTADVNTVVHNPLLYCDEQSI